jgi:N,N'-diacetyllegionaminate synthase
MLFIAEVGMNHNGNFALCYELIKQAKWSGADIVKFQLGWRDKPDEINCIDEEILKKLFLWADYHEIEIMFSVITPNAFNLIKKFNPNRYKVASRTVIDYPEMVPEIISMGKETFISLGMWDKQHVPFGSGGNIKYLWCKSKYPCEPHDMLDFPKSFEGSPWEGYSDHTIGIDMSLLAIARGAKVIEKHFTLDKSDTTIRDHALSATPDEFNQLVRLGKEISKKIQIGI